MRSVSLLACLATALLACGDDPVEPVELGEVCGAAAPFRALVLGPAEMAPASEMLRAQGRDFYVVRLITTDAPRPENSSVWTTGPCGESPVQVATGIDDIFTLPVWPDLVLGCEQTTGNVVLLNPTGATDPHVIFPAVPKEFSRCGFAWTDHGLLSLDRHDDDLAALRLHPYPADPRTEVSEPEVLLDQVRITPSNGGGPGTLLNVLYAFPTEVLALTAGDELIRVDLADRSLSTLQVEVTNFDASRDGQHLLWQHSGVTRADPVYPEGQISLRDRSTDRDIVLAASSLILSILPLQWIDRGIVQLRVGFTNSKSLFFLPDFAHVDVPVDLFLRAQLPDGRWLSDLLSTDTYPEATDLRTGEKTRLFPRKAMIVRIDADAIEVLEAPQSEWNAEGPLWHVPLDGSPTTKLAQRASRDTRTIADGRLLGPLDIDASSLATLMLLGPTSEQRIDDHVHRNSIDTSRTADESLVRYSVSDGERSGVYLARLPPP